jgi:hypothetical protein
MVLKVKVVLKVKRVLRVEGATPHSWAEPCHECHPLG